MTETDALVDALKRQLRKAGLTYAAAASALGLSEASVKRLFSERSFSLQRLETLCELVGIDIAELVRLSEQARRTVTQLSEAQERELAANPQLLLAAVCALNRLSFEEILGRYQLEEAELVGALTRLDRLGILELLPGNRYRLNINRGFEWRHNGPIQRYFMGSVMRDVVATEAGAGREQLRFAWGMLSSESAEMLRERVRRLNQEFNELADGDLARPPDMRRGAGLLTVLRLDWEPGEFVEQRR
ncbi:MAG: helix-turn-helix transcriptional regulator [Gammaproteobacteria bacterium]|nr:helix-turn-helix transcriptional regulator [Gammaproteobacteria bacterium]